MLYIYDVFVRGPPPIAPERSTDPPKGHWRTANIVAKPYNTQTTDGDVTEKLCHLHLYIMFSMYILRSSFIRIYVIDLYRLSVIFQ